MANKGKVKFVKGDATGKIVGTVTDLVTKIDYPFELILNQHPNLKVDSIVQFATTIVDGKVTVKDLELASN